MLRRVALAVSLFAAGAGAAGVWTLEKVPYVPGAVLNDTDLPTGGFTPANPNRQHLSLALVPGASSSNRTGVHVFAHGSGGTVPGLSLTSVSSMRAAGYAALSWESVTDLNGNSEFTPAEYVATCLADLELVLAWLVNNADQYGLDLNDVNMGGRSRGSVCSWAAAHADHPGLNVSGIYMYNALPLNAQTDADFEVIALDPIGVDSPPAYLAYGPECPKPIDVDGCEPTPMVEQWNGVFRLDIHNPRFGQKIVDRYEELGAGDRITLSDGMTNANISSIYFYFESFIESLKLNVNPGPAPPSTPPTAAPTPTPTPAPTPEPVCADNSTGIIALAATVNVVISGCTDGRVVQRCNRLGIQNLCCATCAGHGGGNNGAAVPPAAAGSGNPFADGADANTSSGASSTTWRRGNRLPAGAALTAAAALSCLA